MLRKRSSEYLPDQWTTRGSSTGRPCTVRSPLVPRVSRPGDRSLIVFDEFVPVGAAWYRLFTGEDAGFGFVDEQTPELAIAVVPSRRGRGYGGELLSALLDCARKDGFEAISLSVAKDNPARHLYENYGFEPVREDDGAVVMRAALSADNPGVGSCRWNVTSQ